MNRSPRDLLRGARPGAAEAASARVIVAVRPDPSVAAVSARLQALGLVVERTIGDKIVGTIDRARLETLRADPAVREVETSVRLAPHAPPRS
jgi:hypothetical protein